MLNVFSESGLLACVPSNIYFDPDDTNTIVEEDKQLLDNYIKFQSDFGIDDYIYNTSNKCPLILRLIFNKYKMLDKNVSMIDIYNVLLQNFGDKIQRYFCYL